MADPLGYAVSAFAPTPLYRDRGTYVYAAPVRAGGGVVGGIGIVFDGQPQFAAMLEAALPVRTGSMGFFVRPDGALLSATAHLPVTLPNEVLQLAPGESWSGVLTAGDQCFAAGATCGSGYREFKTADGYEEPILAVVLVPCGRVASTERPAYVELTSIPGGEEIATFRIGQQLLGVRAAEVVECVEVRQAVRPSSGEGGRHAGFTEFAGAMLPLLDLAADLGEPPSTRSQAIVLRHGGLAFGLLVDELGSIAELKVLPAPGAGSGSGAQLVEHIAQAGRELVVLLSAEGIAAAALHAA